MATPGPATIQNNGSLWSGGANPLPWGEGANAAAIPFPIAEVLEDPGLSNVHFSCEGGRATWPWQIPWGSTKGLLSAMMSIVGFSYTAGGKLRRRLPMKHPLFPNMWAKEITGWKPKGFITKGALNAGQAAIWTRLELTVSYWVPPFVVGSDGFVDQAGGFEYNRFLEKRPKAATRMVGSEASEFTFYNVPTGYKRTIKQSVGRQIMEGLIEYIWWWVPEKYVMGSTPGYPSNIYLAVGKVNSDVFLGHNPGTLLLETPDLKEYGQPIGTAGNGDVQIGQVDGQGPPLMYTITLPMKKLDPDLGVVAGGAEQPAGADPGKGKSSATRNPRYQGHNVRIHPDSKSGLAYPIQTGSGSQPPYQAVSFANIFKAAP